jgi:hypothetical protein
MVAAFLFICMPTDATASICGTVGREELSSSKMPTAAAIKVVLVLFLSEKMQNRYES